jgi:altronate hydrolase
LIGRFSDYLVEQGGTTVLTEVPEMFGAETILMNRCVNRGVFDKMVEMVNDFKNYYKKHNQVIYDNPSPGNKNGGISSLEDKSLGCTTKAGDSLVVDVLKHTERLKIPGLNLISAPGNDAVATTTLGMCGCHLVLFSTGRGTPFGGFIPTVKISTNTPLFEKKPNWIDFNAGQLVDGLSMDAMLEEFTEKVITIIDGEKTRQELNNYREIAIFKTGVTL